MHTLESRLTIFVIGHCGQREQVSPQVDFGQAISSFMGPEQYRWYFHRIAPISGSILLRSSESTAPPLRMTGLWSLVRTKIGTFMELIYDSGPP